MTGGPVAVVTGAGSGIGRAAALGLSEAGWRLALIGRRKQRLEETVAQAKAEATAIVCDVGDAEAVRAAFAAIVIAFGRVDLLFNNAGAGAHARTIDEVSDEDWRTVMRANLDGAFFCARAAFAVMRRQSPQGGRIINNGSIAAHAPRPGAVAYTASKHAITGLTRSIALDGRAFNIACGQIDIGNADTAMMAAAASGFLQADGSVRSEPVMAVSDVVAAVVLMAGLPLQSNVQFLTIQATAMPWIGRG